VALKLLPRPLAADDTARKRLVREAQAAAGLDHPNICTIYEVGEADGHSYIAMQYIDGETLAERLKGGPLDLPSAIAVGRQVAEALAEAHRLGIVHRDIKPANIIQMAPPSLRRSGVVRARSGCTTSAASGCSRRRGLHSIRVCRQTVRACTTCSADRHVGYRRIDHGRYRVRKNRSAAAGFFGARLQHFFWRSTGPCSRGRTAAERARSCWPRSTAARRHGRLHEREIELRSATRGV
jgi:hypothetical protein